MNRRATLLLMAGVIASAVLPSAARPVNALRLRGAPDEMELVQYGVMLPFGQEDDAVMPAYVKNALDRSAFETSQQLGLPIVSREYLWLNAKAADKSDPLTQHAVGAMKFFVEEPRAKHDARVSGEIAAGGWVLVTGPISSARFSGKRVEFADFRLAGRVARYGRVTEDA